MIEGLAQDLDFVELTENDALSVVKAAQSQGVRGARIHDLMHSEAAKKYQAKVLFTLDVAGFGTLKSSVPVKAP